MRIHIKRIYDKASRTDGTRILVDRLWPRGIKKEAAKIVYWAKDVAPSNELRRWYNHDHSKWNKFKKRYFAELDANPEGIAAFQEHFSKEITFLFGSKEQELNNAAALREYVKTQLE